MGWLTQVSSGGRNFNYLYDTVGRRTQLQYPNGMTVGYTYDTRGRLTDIHNRDAANVTLDRYTYTYDTADNITQVVDAATAKWVYAYDNRYRLTQAERYLGTTLKHRYTYGYDAADNVTAQSVYNASAGTTNSTAYTYNAGNELTQSVSSANGTTGYTYDSWGRLATITRGTQSATLGWAYQDRLKSYTTTLTGERSQNFSYTGDGRRNALDNALLGAKTWSYDQNWGVRTQSYTSYPDYSAWYILEPGGTLLASAPASGVATTLKYYVKDHLGSTRSLRLENTTRSVGFEYDPYGGLYTSSGITGFTQDRFTGHEFDIETNLYWAPYRYYRPDMLRWVSRDPLGMVDGPNVYGYVGGNPITRKDSVGLFTLGGDCKGQDGKIKDQIQKACDNLNDMVIDPKYKNCIADKCEKGKINCLDSEDDNCDSPCVMGKGGTITGPDGKPQPVAFLCIQNILKKEKDNVLWQPDYGKIALHEWAHSCGWIDGEGGGIPYPDGKYE